MWLEQDRFSEMVMEQLDWLLNHSFEIIVAASALKFAPSLCIGKIVLSRNAFSTILIC